MSGTKRARGRKRALARKLPAHAVPVLWAIAALIAVVITLARTWHP